MKEPTTGERGRNILSTDHLTPNLGRRTARGGVTAITAQLTRVLAQLAIAAVMARLLAPSDFGLVAMAMTVTGFIGLFTDLGLSAATVQQREIDQPTVSALFYINVAMGCVLMLVCVAAAPLAAWFFGDHRLLWLTIALAASIPVAAAGAQHGALLQRGMRWMEMQWTPILAQLAGGIVGVLLAWKGGIGYWALVGQAWVTAAVSTALLWHFTRWRPDFVPRLRHAHSALRFGLNLTGFNLVNYFHRQFDNVLIGWRWGAVDLGYYTRAYTLLTLPLTLVSGPITSAVVPALSRLQDDPERWRSAFLKAFGALNLVSAGLTTMLVVSAEPLVRMIFGPQWAEAGRIFAFLAISMFAATPVNATGWIYISLGQTRRMFQWALMVTPFYVAAYIIGLPFGGRGVALCYSIVMCLAAVPYLAYATAKSPVALWPVVKAGLPPAALGALIVTSQLLFRWLPSGHSALVQIALNSSLIGGLYLTGAALLLASNNAFAPLRADMRRLCGRLASRARRYAKC